MDRHGRDATTSMTVRTFSTKAGRARLHPLALIGGIALSAILLASTGFGRWLEEDIGLAWLFKLRGAIPPPAEVVVVSIDQSSSRALALPNKPRKWPRALHGELVDRLHALGATAIAFDIIFEEIREPEDNTRFAQALRIANNVVLFQYLKQENLANNSVLIEKLISPVDVLKDNAFALAPFPLPKVPAKVNHFLLYKPELGDAPTIPVVMLQLYCLDEYDSLLTLLRAHAGDQLPNLPASAEQIRQQRNLLNVVSELHRLFREQPTLAPRLLNQLAAQPELPVATRQHLTALIRTYASPYSRYLNLYGGPRSLTTLSYAQVLQDKHLDLRNKAVFVGFSEQFQPEQKDGFYTVFSEENSGLDISGVEIMASAFANLLQQNALRVPSGGMDILLLLLWSVMIFVALLRLPGMWQVPLALLLGLGYGGLNYYFFSMHAYWLPLTTPLLWQLPLTTLGVLLLTYRRLQRERKHIREAFGYHLPANVVDRIARGMDPLAGGEHVHGIVLATDAAQYTTLSEKLSAGELHRLMNAYYEVLFAPIRTAGGIISDVQGDAALAIWPAASNSPAQREQACQAALALAAAVDQFNATQATPLPTRIGLHCGEIVMGHVGALDHYEYRAVGDIVNSASRLEGLNKHLGTRILVSHAVIDGLQTIVTRELGSFRLVGKQQPLAVFELLGTTGTAASNVDFALFARALDAFKAAQWQTASALFQQYLLIQPKDGPSHFYLQQCTLFAQNPPASWEGVLELTRK